MLPAERRVHRREEFTATVRQGRRVHAPGLVLYLRSDDSGAPARAGFIVARPVGPAVRRNRVRRQLRHLIAPYLEHAPAGIAIVIRVTDGASRLTGAALADALAAALAKAGVSTPAADGEPR
ncbi:MAG TPA: ribonuclease P protein component [Mycobacteriales bacterium]|nr:ribonuclease P protein component [Mycobacteriales bacterium]